MDLPGIHELLNIIDHARDRLIILTKKSMHAALLHLLRERYRKSFYPLHVANAHGAYVHVVRKSDCLLNGEMIVFHAKISKDYLVFLLLLFDSRVSMFIEGRRVRDQHTIWREVYQGERDGFLRCCNLPCLEMLA